MATLLRMPGVSADSEEAVLEAWVVTPGASVSSGDTVATVETEKAVVDIDVDRDAVVHALLAEAGSTVPVGDPIAILLEPGESAEGAAELERQLGQRSAFEEDDPREAEAAPATRAPAAAEGARADASGDRGAVGLPSPNGRLFASPIARRLAKEMSIDLGSLAGTGPNGRITRDDVRAAADTPEPEGSTETSPSVPSQSGSQVAAAASAATASAQPGGEGSWTVPHTKLRKAVASRLQESKRNAPHFYLTAKLNADRLMQLRAEINEHASDRISVNDLLVKAAGRALADVPEMNVSWSEEGTVHYPSADVAVAVASDRGLVTPVVRDINRTPLSSLSRIIKDMASRANEGKLQQRELEGGALSVTNLGMYGVDEFAAIINPPQAAILAVGAARKEVAVDDDGEFRAVTVITVTLSVDHRPVDGVVAARWLARFRQLVESPLEILV